MFSSLPRNLRGALLSFVPITLPSFGFVHNERIHSNQFAGSNPSSTPLIKNSLLGGTVSARTIHEYRINGTMSCSPVSMPIAAYSGGTDFRYPGKIPPERWQVFIW